MANLMMASVYDALIDAGASEAKARRAAEDIVNYDDRLSAVERRLDRLDAKIDALAATVVAEGKRLDGKIDALEKRLDTKIDALEKRMNIQFGILAAMVGAILVRSFT